MAASPPLSLDREEMESLYEEQIIIIGGSHGNGKRKVSSALLSPPHSTVSSAGSCSSASVRVREHSSSTTEPFDLPENYESVASLEMIGYTRPAAGEIFQRWISRPDAAQNIDSFLQYAISNLDQVQQLENLPAAQALETLGISAELKATLTNPEFEEIFKSQTLYYWLVDTMTIRNATLLKLLQRLKTEAINTVAKRKEKKRPKIEGAFESTSASTPQLSTISSVASNASAFVSKNSNALPSSYCTTEAMPELLPDHVLLFKGKVVGDMLRERFIFEDGAINMRSLITQPGGDFNQQTGAWYFTKEETTAEKYRKFGEARCPYSESWIIQMQVPKNFMHSLCKEYLWFSNEWKEYVWYCRGGAAVEDPPEQYDKLWKSAHLVEGPICCRVSEVITNIKKEEIRSRMTEDFVMKVDGRKASQSVFMDRESVVQLGILVRGKIYIDIHPPSVIKKQPNSTLT